MQLSTKKVNIVSDNMKPTDEETPIHATQVNVTRLHKVTPTKVKITIS